MKNKYNKITILKLVISVLFILTLVYILSNIIPIIKLLSKLSIIILILLVFFALYSRNKKYKSSSNSWIEVDLSLLQYNFQLLRGLLPKNCEMMAVIKADAYGHGSIQLAKALNKMGVYEFCVANIDEAIELRKNRVKGNILILGYTHPNAFYLLSKYNLTQTIFSYEYAKELSNKKANIKVHIKIDTGMNRLGIPYYQSEEMIKTYLLPHLTILGTYSHLACSDSLEEEDIEFTNNQIKRFNKVLELLKKYRIDYKNTHLQSSYGLLNYPNLEYNNVRIGIALYGVLSTTSRNTVRLASKELKPILSLKSKIAFIKEVNKDENVSYNRNYTTTKKTKIATIPIGYGDGYPRNLSNQFYVLIQGYKAPIIGNICMDQMMIDITDIPIEINQNDEVILIGKSGDLSISVEKIAELSNTITNEVLTGFNKRLPIHYK